MDDESGGKGPLRIEAQSDRAKLIHNEQVKMTANTINGTALAFIVGGGVATIISQTASLESMTQLLQTTAWILSGFALHSSARIVLRMLR